jgi:flavin-dependent dehydrogenase
MYDVAIVGGGPAGSTLARLLGRSLRVLLVERRELRDWRTEPSPAKVCGGLLAPDAQRALAALGLGVPRELLVGPQLFAVRAIDAGSGRVRRYARAYLNVDRGRLDAWLLSLAPAGATVRLGWAARAIVPAADGATLVLERAGRTERVRARLVVGADGAGSRVRRAALPGAPRPPTYAAVQEWCEADGADAAFTAVFDPRVTDFYGWAIPKDGRLVVGAALRPGRGARARLALVRDTLARHGVAVGRVLRREGTLLHRPARATDVATGSGAVALVGEAAGLVSPSSAEGLSYAFRSAAALAAALDPGLEGWARRYRAATRALRLSLALKRLKSPFMFRPALRRAVMASGLGSLELLP